MVADSPPVPKRTPAVADEPDRIEERLAAFPPLSLDPDERAPAGVLVPLFPDGEGGVATLLTVRTRTVRDHKGQISFPGGVREPADPDLVATALRETAEEVGIPPESVRVLGRLDDLPTLTGYLIRPYVGYLSAPPSLRANPVEIAEMLVVRIDDLAADGVFAVRPIRWAAESVVDSDSFALGRHVVWGATARILKDLLRRLVPSFCGQNRVC
jgi:8-oxo-dGTP pyrophosphatase MutT (NUDIX family)